MRIDCGQKNELAVKEHVRCNACGYRILYKTRKYHIYKSMRTRLTQVGRNNKSDSVHCKVDRMKHVKQVHVPGDKGSNTTVAAST